MQERKKSNPKLQVIFSSILLALIFIVELYAMINLPNQFVVIGLLGAVILACLYVLIHAVLDLLAVKEARREEQYESIFKSEKASYLMLKKYFEEIEGKLDIIEKASKVPTEEIVGTQKGIGKVIINRSRENAEAIMSSNDMLVESVSELEGTIATNNEKLIDSYKSISEESVQQMLLKQQDVLMSLKDMEIRLNNAIMQSQKVVAQAAPVYAAPVMSAPAPAPVMPEAVAPMPEEIPAMDIPVFEEAPTEAVVEPEPAVEPEVVAEPEPIPEPESVVEPEPEPIPEPVPVVEPEPEPVAEPEPAPAAPEIDLSDPNKKLGADEIAALFASMGQESAPAEPAPEPVVEPEPEPIPEPVAEPEPAPAAPEIDLSDPNKKLGADEIAALFASMGQESAPAEPVVEPEPESIPEPVAEPEPAPAAPEIDLSDPNKKLGADEIAALFASMSEEATATAPEPEPEPAPAAPAVDLSDPNKQLSPDEIAALFSSMTS